MDKKIILSNQSDSIQKITIISTIQCEKEPNEQYMAKKIQFLQPIDALKFLNTLPQDNHFVYCQKAQIYLKLEKIQQVSKMCQKAFEYNAKCKKCIQNYLNLYQFFTIRKLPLIDNLLKKFENQEIKDDNLYNLLLKMKKIIKTDQQFQDFFNQLKQSGAQFSKISLYQDNNNRTAIAKSSIQKDETILYIPKQKLILLEQARQSLIVKKIHQQKLYLRSPKHCQLTIFLLEQEQLGQQSPYYFYMKHLPNQFQSFPINYKEHELEYLKGSPFLEQIQSKKIDMKRDFQAIISVCPQFKRFSYESFKNFRLIVSSRIFGITVGKNRTDVLAPLADMLNHNVPKQTSWYYSDQYEGFVIKSIKPISKGQQIYDSYGQKCNSRFLLNYGFTLSSNQANQVVFIYFI